MKNSLVIYTSYQEQLSLLTMEQRGVLLTAILAYASGDDMPEMDGITCMAFAFIKADIDRDAERYEKICEARREAGKKGGRPKAKGYEEITKKANGYFEKENNPDNDNEYDNDSKKEDIPKGISKKKFSPPSLDEVQEYISKQGYTVDAQRFVDFYSSKGWMVGKSPMKDWKAAVRNWSRSQRQETTTKVTNKFNNFNQRDFDWDQFAREFG